MNIGVFSSVVGGVKRFEPAVSRYEGLALKDLGVPALPEHLDAIQDCEAIIYTPFATVTEEYWKGLADRGVKYVLTCSAGYDHFDLPMMKKHGLKASYVPFYSPNAISEHAVMTALAILRKFKEQIHRIDNIDYRIAGLLGQEMRNQTIGVVGAGRIGLTTLKCLSGFGAKKTYAYDLYQNDEVKEYAEYTDLDTIYKECTMIIFHCNLNESNYHMINAESIAKMQDGVFLVNAARGGLFDTKDLLAALKAGKFGGVALDVIDEELALRKMEPGDAWAVPEMEELLACEDFIFTRHTAFYTDEANRNMSDTTIESAYNYMTTGESQFELIK